MAISIKNKTRHLLSRRISWLKNKTSLAAIAALVILPAVTVLAFTYGPMASIEAEDSQLSGGATIVADSNASGGQSVRFGSEDPGGTDPELPDIDNTGPRYPILRTLSSSEALTELRDEGYLSQVRVTGNFRLSGSDGRNWVIEDSVFEAGSLYGIQSYNSLTAFTGTYEERPIFRHVEISGQAARGVGTCEAGFYGSDIVFENAVIHGCKDGAKPSNNVTIQSSWFRDNDHPTGAHCDSIQITRGTNILVRDSRLDAYIGYSSDGSQVPDGSTCSGALQTGAATGDISAVFENNWFAGGHYTIRGWSSSDTSAGDMSYTFTGNKWREYGSSVALGLDNLEPSRWGPVTGILGDFDDSNVWEHTGIPINQ